MTVAVVALALAVLVLGGGLVAATGWGRKALEAQAVLAKEALGSEQKARELEDARDRALADVTQRTSELDTARKASAIHEAAAKAAREELSKYVREKLATGSDDDVAAELDRLLGAVPKAEAPAAVPDVPTSTPSDDRRPA